MAYDDNNVFARIIRGELPCHKVLEDETTLAFLDVSPGGRGHTLVLPKARARNIFDIDDAALAALVVRVRRVARAVHRAFGSDGVSIQQFNEEAEGQSVFHLHFHVVPRWEGIPLRISAARTAERPEALAEQAALIRAALQ